MKTPLPLIAAALVLAAGAHAQERTAGQAYDAQVNWTALNNKIDLVSSQNKVLALQMDKMLACNKKGMIYAPGAAKADANDCLSPLSEIETVVVSDSVCLRASNAHTKTVTCPAGTTLLGCSGGPGDVDEKDEGYFVRPNGANGCEMVVGQPRCVRDEYWTYSWVFAHCAKLK